MSDKQPMMRFTDDALMQLHNMARENPGLWQNPHTNFLRELRDRKIHQPEEDTGLTAAGPIRMPMPEESHIQLTDRNALEFRDNIPGIEAKHLADPNFLAWISCIHLLKYGIVRWPFRNQQDPSRWAIQHFLSRDSRDMSNSSVAGRPLWLSEISRRAAEAMGTTTPQQILDLYAGHTDVYHIQNEFQVLRAPGVMAAYTQAILEEARGASGRGVREIARDLNRASGARLLDTVRPRTLREITERSVDRMMRVPDFVSDRRMLRGVQPLRVLSLGAGVQSSCLALMADQAYEGLEPPDCAIFADTGWEPPAVYQHLKWLKSQLSFPVHTVQAGNIRDDILEGRTPTGRNFISIPVHTLDSQGKPGIGKRQCTSEYKLKPIFRKVRELLKIPDGKRAQKDQHAEIWIGITVDEADRAKPSREEYITNRHPLLERGISRRQLVDWFSRHHQGRELPRSACIGCPYRTDTEWRDLKEADPKSFEDAADVDWALRNLPALRSVSQVEMYLSRQRVPLMDLNLRDAPTGEDLHQEECEGMCWI